MKKVLIWLYVSLIVFVVGVALLNSFYVTPIADDFLWLSKEKVIYPLKDIWFYASETYKNWDGRYSYVFLIMGFVNVCRFFGIGNESLVVINAFLEVLGFILSFSLLISLIFKQAGFSKEKCFFSLLLAVFTFLLFNPMAEFIYWFAGSFTYNLGFVMFCLLLHTHEKRGGMGWFWFKVAMIFLAGGLVQYYLIAMAVYFFVDLIFEFLEDRRINGKTAWLLIFSIAFSIINFGAPGNLFRRELAHAVFHPRQFLFLGNWISTSFGTFYAKMILLGSFSFALFVHHEGIEMDKRILKRFFFSFLLGSMAMQLFSNIANGQNINLGHSERGAHRTYGIFLIYSIMFSTTFFLWLLGLYPVLAGFFKRHTKLYNLTAVVILVVVIRFSLLGQMLVFAKEGPKFRERYHWIAQMIEESLRKTPVSEMTIKYGSKEFKTGVGSGVALTPFVPRLLVLYYGVVPFPQRIDGIPSPRIVLLNMVEEDSSSP